MSAKQIQENSQEWKRKRITNISSTNYKTPIESLSYRKIGMLLLPWDTKTKLCGAVAYHAKRTKNDVKLVLSLTKKWIDMIKVINDGVVLRKLSDGAVAAKEL